MNNLITQFQFDYIVEGAFQHPLHFLWYCTDIGTTTDCTKLPSEIATFQYRQDVFLSVLHRLLREGRLKLAKDGKILQSPPDELVDLFRKAWPINEEAMDDGVWFFDDTCPANAVWVLEDGTLDWA